VGSVTATIIMQYFFSKSHLYSGCFVLIVDDAWMIDSAANVERLRTSVSRL